MGWGGGGGDNSVRGESRQNLTCFGHKGQISSAHGLPESLFWKQLDQ